MRGGIWGGKVDEREMKVRSIRELGRKEGSKRGRGSITEELEKQGGDHGTDAN